MYVPIFEKIHLFNIGCGESDLCPLEDFEKIVKPCFLEDWRQMCKIENWWATLSILKVYIWVFDQFIFQKPSFVHAKMRLTNQIYQKN